MVVIVVGGDNLVGESTFGSRASVGWSSSVKSVGVVGRHRWIVAVVTTAVWWLRRWRWISRVVVFVVRVLRNGRYGFVSRAVAVSRFDEYGWVRVGIVVVVVNVVVV